jgi:CheY-like chemotaxis protein
MSLGTMARNATLRLTLDDAAGMLCLELRDDGRGIDLDHGTGFDVGASRRAWRNLGDRIGHRRRNTSRCLFALPVFRCTGGQAPGAATEPRGSIMTEGDIIRILIAADHLIFRDGMRGLLESLADTEVVAEAETGDEVIALAETLQPDVILMDLKMPGCNGIEATKRILQTSPHIGVLVITMFEDDDSVFTAIRRCSWISAQGCEPG